MDAVGIIGAAVVGTTVNNSSTAGISEASAAERDASVDVARIKVVAADDVEVSSTADGVLEVTTPSRVPKSKLKLPLSEWYPKSLLEPTA
jgi:flagellar basal body rod protein FlgF